MLTWLLRGKEELGSKGEVGLVRLVFNKKRLGMQLRLQVVCSG